MSVYLSPFTFFFYYRTRTFAQKHTRYITIYYCLYNSSIKVNKQKIIQINQINDPGNNFK